MKGELWNCDYTGLQQTLVNDTVWGLLIEASAKVPYPDAWLDVALLLNADNTEVLIG